MNALHTLIGREQSATALDNGARSLPHRADERRPHWGWLVSRFLGAGAVLAVGAIHLQQYLGSYGAIPTIGPLFLLNFVAATAIGITLLAPLEHVTGRWARAAVALVTSGGLLLAATSYVLLFVSERTPVFGFQEPGYDPAAITASRIAEIAAVVLLGASLVARFATRAPRARW